jgi:hypothetical protein
MHFAPASLTDYTAMFPAAGQRQWKAARVQILGGLAWVLWRGEERLALCGLYPFHSGIFEAWLMMTGRPSLSALRFLLDRTAMVMPDRTIICRIRDDNRAGQRMALLSGFVPVDDFLDAAKTIRTWSRPRAA